MSSSEKILKSLSSLIENGLLTSKDIKNEISTDLKFTRDKIINKLDLVSREDFEVLKKIVQKQDATIKKLIKSNKTKGAKKS
ncbi:accessory factor UbiK family protein [Pelagibacteraceae bacterium]|jgi:BMFP domain-containing protein YqiC|nr:accessory factor UbiK family protein [Pelagibacteraceae bacterium]